MGADVSNRPAKASLIFGTTSFVALSALAIGLWASFVPGAWVAILYFIALGAAILAIAFAVEGFRVANVRAAGRVTATIGLVLGIAFIVLTIVALIVISVIVGNGGL
jgi:hypothetical protein